MKRCQCWIHLDNPKAFSGKNSIVHRCPNEAKFKLLKWNTYICQNCLRRIWKWDEEVAFKKL